MMISILVFKLYPCLNGMFVNLLLDLSLIVAGGSELSTGANFVQIWT